MRPRTGTLTTTEYAVLTVLTVETQCVALSGYDLLKIVERTTRYFWKPTKSHLYAVLPRLVERGLATRKAAPGARGPERQLYRVTPKGDRLAREWLEEPVPGDKDLFHLKVFYGGLQSREAVVDHYRRHLEEREAALEELLAILLAIPKDRRGHNYFHSFLLRLGIESARLDIRWAEDVLKELEQ